MVGRAEWAVPASEGLFLLLPQKKSIPIRLPKEHSLTHEVRFVVILFVFKEICLL